MINLNMLYTVQFNLSLKLPCGLNSLNRLLLKQQLTVVHYENYGIVTMQTSVFWVQVHGR